MNADDMIEFKQRLARVPALPFDQRGEFGHDVSSGWIDGVYIAGETQCSNSEVLFRRFANNDERHGVPVLEYSVDIALGPKMHSLVMTPQSAVQLGQVLIETGSAALCDLSLHAWFLQGARS